LETKEIRDFKVKNEILFFHLSYTFSQRLLTKSMDLAGNKLEEVFFFLATIRGRLQGRGLCQELNLSKTDIFNLLYYNRVSSVS
jgi:hypothetical protein